MNTADSHKAKAPIDKRFLLIGVLSLIAIAFQEFEPTSVAPALVHVVVLLACVRFILDERAREKAGEGQGERTDEDE